MDTARTYQTAPIPEILSGGVTNSNGFHASCHPLLPHPEPLLHKVDRARDALAEHVDFIAGVREEISALPGTDPGRHPLLLMETLLDRAAHLLSVMNEADAARRR